MTCDEGESYSNHIAYKGVTHPHGTPPMILEYSISPTIPVPIQSDTNLGTGYGKLLGCGVKFEDIDFSHFMGKKTLNPFPPFM